MRIHYLLFESLSTMSHCLPTLARIVNAVAQPLSRSSTSLDLGSLEQEAKLHADASDFGAPGYQKGARVFLDLIDKNRQVHFIGRKLIRELVTQRLQTRLKLLRTLAERPSLSGCLQVQKETPTYERPVFVVGTPRSGTTLLYKLLALDSRARCPRFWEVVDPAPPSSLVSEKAMGKRIDQHERRLRRFKRLLPDSWKRIHAFDTVKDIEEDFYLLEATFRCPSFALIYGPAESYRDYL